MKEEILNSEKFIDCLKIYDIIFSLFLVACFLVSVCLSIFAEKKRSELAGFLWVVISVITFIGLTISIENVLQDFIIPELRLEKHEKCK